MSSENSEYGQIDSSFSMQPLSDLCVEKGGVQTGPFGSQLHQKDYVECGTPIITVEHLGENRIVHSNLPRITDADRKRLSKYWIHEGDIVFSRVGSVDRRALVSSKEDGWLFSGRCLRVRPKQELLDSTYLSYFFGSVGFKKYIRSIAVGATMPSINTKILSEIPIYYPEVIKQKTIAKILKSLDDKIGLNQRKNKTLEEMAQALFKCWFVDFEPTRAKMAGESPDSICQRLNLTADILALFPDKLTESSLGLIPEGWSEENLSEFCDLNPTSWTKRNAPERVEYVDLANTKWGAINSTEEYDFPDAPSRARRILQVGDTIVGTVRPGNGSYAWIGKNGLTGSTGFAVLRPKEEHFSEFVYLAATSAENIEHLAHLADGGAYPAVRSEIVLATRCLIPMDGLIREFSSVVKTFFKLRETNSTSTKTLTQIRDTLLPKLLSGEISVGEAKNIVAM